MKRHTTDDECKDYSQSNAKTWVDENYTCSVCGRRWHFEWDIELYDDGDEHHFLSGAELIAGPKLPHRSLVRQLRQLVASHK